MKILLKKHLNLLTIIIGTIILAVSCSGNDDTADTSVEEVTGSASIGLIDDERILQAENEPGNWLAHGRTYEERRFSPLKQINKETVSELGLVWSKDMGTNRALEATPIVVDGIMFFTSTWSRVYAVDALSGETIWTFDPQVPGEWARKACCDIVNRGVAVYNGKVYSASLDGRLFSLNVSALMISFECLSCRAHFLCFQFNVLATVLIPYDFFECLCSRAYFLLFPLECLSCRAHFL